ncbi:MAG: hypothetical protein M1830_010035 [Pleopsidium flavum]|nr:MAG: hypothetical protein M1830_010035 [Pleopsidium flavum]
MEVSRGRVKVRVEVGDPENVLVKRSEVAIEKREEKHSTSVFGDVGVEARDVFLGAPTDAVREKSNVEKEEEAEEEVQAILRKIGYPRTVTTLVNKCNIKTREKLLEEMRAEERRMRERLGMKVSEEREEVETRLEEMERVGMKDSGEGKKVESLVRSDAGLSFLPRVTGAGAAGQRRSSV